MVSLDSRCWLFRETHCGLPWAWNIRLPHYPEVGSQLKDCEPAAEHGVEAAHQRHGSRDAVSLLPRRADPQSRGT